MGGDWGQIAELFVHQCIGVLCGRLDNIIQLQKKKREKNIQKYPKLLYQPRIAAYLRQEREVGGG